MNVAISSPALGLTNRAAWLWSAAFVAGNLLLPQLCHLVPDGGKIFLPIMFFTLVASVRFGLWCGLLTALASPLASLLIFGVPTGGILTAVLVKSIIIALAFGLWRQYRGSFSVWSVAGLIVACQIVCFVAEGALLFGLAASWRELLISWPGMLLQLAGAMLVIKYWK